MIPVGGDWLLKTLEVDLVMTDNQPSHEFVTPEHIGALALFLFRAGRANLRRGAVGHRGWTAQ